MLSVTLEAIPALLQADDPPLLLALLTWAEGTTLGEALRNSLYAVAVIMATHLLGLALMGGAVLVVDMRMLGAGLKTQKVAALSRYARPWLVTGLVLLTVTGVLMLFATGVKYYYNTSFWVKMISLPLAIVFTFVVRDRIARNDRLDSTIWVRLTGAASIALWFTVAAAGRWIGFS